MHVKWCVNRITGLGLYTINCYLIVRLNFQGPRHEHFVNRITGHRLCKLIVTLLSGSISNAFAMNILASSALFSSVYAQTQNTHLFSSIHVTFSSCHVI